ncbi:hypothetical protein L3X38_012947 [Prunus dulcis]|uniref:E3 ubiquitin-protein ligase RMA n=1 Tax=Prunus dulcis TaxID=3755 RepID=A0AAD4ZGI6_PRUDU|nr:hypothetical protein L3X38_012947 [Prunus dulcis]
MASINESMPQVIKVGFQSRKPRMRVMKPPQVFHFRIPEAEPKECDLMDEEELSAYGYKPVALSCSEIKPCSPCEASSSMEGSNNGGDPFESDSFAVHSVGGSCSTSPPDAWSSTHHDDDDDEQESHELGASFCHASPESSSPPRLAFYFDCKLCLKMAREPVVTPCGHLFCGDCLDKWLHFFTSQMECPVCHSKVLDSSIIPIRPTPVCNRDLDLNVPPRSKGGLCF